MHGLGNKKKSSISCVPGVSGGATDVLFTLSCVPREPEAAESGLWLETGKQVSSSIGLPKGRGGRGGGQERKGAAVGR